MPKHWANAVVLECGLPAPEVQVSACTQKKRLQEGVLTRRLWQVTASKCSRSPAQTALAAETWADLASHFPERHGSAAAEIRDSMCCAHNAAGHSGPRPPREMAGKGRNW